MSDTVQPPFDYIAEAHVTASGQYHGNKVPRDYFLEVMHEAMTVLAKLDQIKKTLFYGRELNVPNLSVLKQNSVSLPSFIDAADPARAERIIHGIIGKATESGELLEALYAAMFQGQPLDATNVGEEIGDGFWYDALLLRAIGSDFDREQRRNIAKLRVRFPDAFTAYDANNRNLDAERRTLEAGSEALRVRVTGADKHEAAERIRDLLPDAIVVAEETS